MHHEKVKLPSSHIALFWNVDAVLSVTERYILKEKCRICIQLFQLDQVKAVDIVLF